MIKKKKKVVRFCSIIIGAMVLFPPFHLEGFDLGYGFLFDPPKRLFIAGEINYERLLIQIVLVVLAGYIFMSVTGKSKRHRR